MIRDQFLLDISDELIIDNFAGGGGASCGIELALGRHVDHAINHDPEAVAMHAMNHPQTEHHCESVWDVDPLALTQSRPVGLAWFSPDCKHFSKAKGGAPVKKEIRGLAWIILRWMLLVRPRVVPVENVEEFVTWGPLIEIDSGEYRPDPARKGETFKGFVAMLSDGISALHPAFSEACEFLNIEPGSDHADRLLNGLGYTVEWRELRACDYGAPTIRKRLFLIARCDGKPIVWPEPTHGAPGSAAVIAGQRKPWRTAAECIDWSIPCPSIFERKKELAETTQRRIARGMRRYVINSADPFIVKVNHGYDYFRGQPLGEPIQTLTGKHGFGLVAPVLTECANASTQRSWRADEPLRTQCAEVKGEHFALASATLVQTGYGERPGQAPRAPGLDKPLGTVVAGGAKHALVSAFLAKHYGGNYDGPGVGLKEPAGTITTADHHALVSSHMVKLRGECTGGATSEPVPTISAQGNHIGEVRAFLVKYYGNKKDGVDVREPMHTIPCTDRMGLVTVAGQTYQIADIGMRMLEPHELYAAQGFPSTYVIAPVFNGKRLAKHAQVRMCGNSVSPPIAAALVRANVPELAAWTSKERKRLATA
ncbi:DNA cytosine methyltransferase [Pandoraea bronchicola]|uniref:DNA (cytosine-5-)-methyltransferase n=1 Tax=Pandoraea bronchicola TaxID=2508287 RepID=A0A5E5BY92_9BURK|nr:DNA cytosine methyltransferase [Pandoraea bronchicola]VVE90306.1 putative cytosine-specific modification methylase [Pandoraea bronchicola]